MKPNRQQLYAKYDGKCAYCGSLLKKGWHADHLIPCRRKFKFVAGINNKTKEYLTPQELNNLTAGEYAQSDFTLFRNYKSIPDGYENPEANHHDNMMPACASCNINKHSMDLEAFRSLIGGFMTHLNEVSTQYKIAKRYGLIHEIPKPVVFYFELYV